MITELKQQIEELDEKNHNTEQELEKAKDRVMNLETMVAQLSSEIER